MTADDRDDSWPQVDCLLEDEQWQQHGTPWDKLASQAVATACPFVPDLPLTFEVCILFSSDAKVQVMNREFRHKDAATDVLSFPQNAMDQGKFLGETPMITPFPLGDIVLSYETTYREAQEQSKTFEAHAQHLIVHGFLHLVGFDHITAKEAEVMEGLEVRVLEKMGISNPYGIKETS